MLLKRSMISSVGLRTEEEEEGQDGVDVEHSPSAASPPSPLSYGRPRAPTPSASPRSHSLSIPLLSSDSPLSISSDFSPCTDSLSDSELPFQVYPSFHRPSKSFTTNMPLPDPSLFPDPYPFRQPHHHLQNLPALSSAGSSSTRSSAYTSSGSGRSAMVSGDYEHVHVASGDDEAVGVGITSDAVIQLLEGDPNVSFSATRGIQSRAPIDQSRWSESYSTSIRSRSSSLGNNNGQDIVPQKLQQKPSYDMGWQTVDERDEEVALSEEETDDDHHLDEEEDEDEEKEEERTSAAVIAEEGRGLIVHGDNVPIVQLNVQPGKLLHMVQFRVLSCFRHYPSFDRLFKHS